jgi:1,4-alpha-glucan branching enzyme
LGGHPGTDNGLAGTAFTVWAPNAKAVSVIGDWNDWTPGRDPMTPVADSGLWRTFVARVGTGARYKYHIESNVAGFRVDKADPFAFFAETPPATGSVVWSLDYEWGDAEWMAQRHRLNSRNAPISIYEVHLASWRLHPDGSMLTYAELASQLVDHCCATGFTHVELLPVMEHPFGGSWGYQTTGFFAPTSRHGSPQDFMRFIDTLHAHGIGVILDWVPGHFPTDEHGLVYFDGTSLYEHADPRLGSHPDWGTAIFNYGRHEVRSFLLSSGIFWLDHFHVDGLRVDAVASMLYLDYSRKAGEWLPNEQGGRENLGAIQFLRQLNSTIYADFPDVQTYAEESTAWPMVTRPIEHGGLGFGLKWDMGWMHDTLSYFALQPVHRRYHQDQLTFRSIYAGHENFVLPLSHDEVVHGKGSMIDRMQGDLWQRFANLRLLYGYQFGLPGKKLLFMGNEIAQWEEWNSGESLDWALMHDEKHLGILRWITDLNHLYRTRTAMFELDCEPGGFEWVAAADADNSVLAFMRRDSAGESVLVAANFTPVPRHGYRIGVPHGGAWRETANSDSRHYGGSGQGNLGGVDSHPVPFNDRPWSVVLTLPPLGVVFVERADG